MYYSIFLVALKSELLKVKIQSQLYREQHNFFLINLETCPCIFSHLNINFWKL